VGQDEAAVRTLIDDALQGVRRLIAAFDDPATPYRSRPRPDKAPRYSDYQHLARVKEWSVSGEDEE
jgi:ATP-dependent helicase/nuclease subunit B